MIDRIEKARCRVLEVHKQISETVPELKYTERVIDWGKPRSQGKRIGGMVVGGMGAGGLSGKKVYRGIDLGEYRESATDEEKGQLRLLVRGEIIDYVRARQFGLNHVEAMVYAKMKAADKI